jgi:predicted RNA-binding protein with PIN domain
MKALLVDGYNLIYAHPRLSLMVSGDMEAAREDLLKELLPLAHPDCYELLMVVFDAAASRQPEAVTEDRRGIKVVFTRAKQSADSFIEAAARRLAADKEVDIATNDRLLAAVASGFGARVLGGVSLFEMAHRALEESRLEAGGESRDRRSPLEERVTEEVRRLLDEMRYR